VKLIPEFQIRVPPLLKVVGGNLFMYGVAVGIVWYESRGLSFHKELDEFAHANLWWLVTASLISFLIWFLGENLLFSRLFTIFHRRTGYLELLPATAAAYFLQTLNVFVSNAAMVLFLHQRKQVPWFAAGFTMAFFGFLDGLLFGFLITIAGALNPQSPVRSYILYSGIALGLLTFIALWWAWRKPRLRIEKWIYNQRSLTVFREATLSNYIELLLIRFGILAPQGLLLWICLAAFHLSIPIRQVLAISPAVLAAGGAPITPAGLGPMQAVAIHTFSKFAPKSKVMAAVLAFSISHLVYRLPLGLGAAHTFIKRLLRSGGDVQSSDDKSRDERATQRQGLEHVSV
jgi:uncharacterized membrane protein YbhN (UPF0104 family)